VHQNYHVVESAIPVDILQVKDSKLGMILLHTSIRWLSTYLRIMAKGAPPQDAAKYKGNQRCSR